jgi:muramoyltetrapeptide carboxypeptidase LdcA involved in peptidoglycan recycling
VLESWGLEVDFGEHVFRKVAWLAGTDEETPGGFQRRIARLAGIAVGQFTDCFHPVDGFTVVDLLRGHLQHFKIPILGGVPVGHGYQSQSILVGTMAFLDAGAGTLTISGTQE